MKKKLLSTTKFGLWESSARQLDAVLQHWSEMQVPEVESIDYIGYSLPHKTYVFNEIAVHAGRVILQNEQHFFEVGTLSIKSLSRLEKMDINPDPKAINKEWFDRFYLCFGARGLLALAYWFGSLFAEQIRDRFESFPFLEIVGEAGSGKTTLLETLWKLFGRNAYEGFDPMKSSHVGDHAPGLNQSFTRFRKIRTVLPDH